MLEAVRPNPFAALSQTRACGPSAGSTTRNSAPCPGRASALARGLRGLARWLRQSPGRARLRPSRASGRGLPRKNLSNTTAACCSVRPGPSSATSTKAGTARPARRSRSPVSHRECGHARSREDCRTTWRSAPQSPITSTGSPATKLIGQLGPTVRAVSTASAARPTSSTGSRSNGVLFVKAGQQQKILDQPPHAGGLPLYSLHKAGKIAFVFGPHPGGRAARRRIRPPPVSAARGRRRTRIGAVGSPRPEAR